MSSTPLPTVIDGVVETILNSFTGLPIEAKTSVVESMIKIVLDESDRTIQAANDEITFAKNRKDAFMQKLQECVCNK